MTGGEGGVLNIALRISQVGMAGCQWPASDAHLCGWLAGDWPSTGAFSTLLRQPGLRTSNGGILAAECGCKMLASTCLYSLYAWFVFCKAWIATRRVSKDDWMEWVRRLSVELLKESPSPALRSCWALANIYNPLARFDVSSI